MARTIICVESLEELVTEGYAQDLTWESFDTIEEIRKQESGFTQLKYESGIYGCSGVLLQGRNSEKLYVVHKRSSALFQLV